MSAHNTPPSPIKPAGNDLLAATIRLIQDLWVTSPPVALVMTVLTVIVFLATIAFLFVAGDTGGLYSFVVIILILILALVFLSWFFRSYTAAGPVKKQSSAEVAKPVRRLGGALYAILAAFNLAFSMPTLADTFPAVKLALQQWKLEQLLTPVCLVRPLADCNTVFQKVDEQAAKPVTPVLNAALPTSVDRNAFKVFVQFAGFQRSTVVTLSTGLHDRGWSVQGYAQGGERLPAAVGLAEVRYGPASDAKAAQQLADEISATQISAKPLTTKQLSIISAGTLEVWIGG